MANRPPARALRANLTEPKSRPPAASRARSARLPTVRMVRMLSSFIFTVFISLYFSAGDDINVAEPGGNPEKEKDEEEPGLCCAEPSVQSETDVSPYGDRHGERDPHRGDHAERFYESFLIFLHAACPPAAAGWENSGFLPWSRRGVNSIIRGGSLFLLL